MCFNACGETARGGKDGLEGNFELIRMHNLYARDEHSTVL